MDSNSRLHWNVNYYCQNLTLRDRYFQSGETALGYPFASPRTGFRPWFLAKTGKSRRLHGVKPMRLRRKAVAFTPQSRCDCGVKPTMIVSFSKVWELLKTHPSGIQSFIKNCQESRFCDQETVWLKKNDFLKAFCKILLSRAETMRKTVRIIGEADILEIFWIRVIWNTRTLITLKRLLLFWGLY